MRRKTLVFCAVLFLISGCNALKKSPLTVAVINPAEMTSSQSLEVQICYPGEIDFSELNVSIYVTERKEWTTLDDVFPYSHYFNPQFISVPGILGQPVKSDLWKASGNFCYSASLEHAFVDTQDWVEHGLCPFQAISVVASYKIGAWNAGTTVECKVSN